LFVCQEDIAFTPDKALKKSLFIGTIREFTEETLWSAGIRLSNICCK